MKPVEPIPTAVSEATRLEQTLSKTTAAALAVSRNAGGDVFGELVTSLARILEVDAAMVARFDSVVPTRVISLAATLDGRLLQPFDYDIEGTPCRSVVGRESRFVAQGIHDEFSQGSMFHALRFDSYAAHSINDPAGRQVGLIVALHRAPMRDRALTEALLKIFAARAGGELERQRADAIARASEASYRSIFEAAEDAIFVHDFDTGRVVDVNPSACRSFGYTHDELLAVHIADVSSNEPPYTEVEAARHMEQARRGDGPVRFEWRRRNKDGSLHWDEVVLKRATIGGHERILAFSREITDRKAAHEALRLREEQYRSIFEGSADALVLWSRDIRIVDVNEAFTAMYGYTREEVIGSTFGDRLPTLDVARRIGMMQRALEGQTGSLETRTIRKSGEAFDVEIRYVPMRHRGEPHVLAVARDITERRRAEAALRSSEAQYRAIFEASADAMLLWNAEYRVVDVNPAYERMYLKRRDDVVGKRIEELIAPHLVESRLELVRRGLRGEGGELQSPGYRSDGSTFELELRTIPVEHHGQPHVLAIGRDITERKRSENALRASEAQYRAIFEAATDALQLLDARHRVVDVNRAYERMYGKRREDVIGKGIEELVPAAFRAERMALVDRALAGEMAELQSTGFREDGTPFDMEVRCIPFEHRGERHVLGIARDITGRRRAEDALRASEARYRMLFEMESSAVMLVDADTLQLVDVNLAAVQTYGYTREELLKMTAADLSDEPEATSESIRGGHGALNIPLRWHRRKDGTKFPVEITANRLELDGRRIVLATIRDITERKLAEQALRASEEQYRAIFNASADALVLRDAEFRIVDVNATYEAMSGFPRAMVLGVDHVIANPPEVAETIRALHQRALAGEAIDFHTTLVRRDGQRYDLELRGVPIQHRGAPHVLYIGRDVTARTEAENRRRELESQLQQAQKMEAIGHLTGGIAHDFNNILTSVMGYVALASERPAAQRDAKIASYLEQAEQSCRRARDLIQQMLAFSRGRGGEPRPVELRTLLGESTRMLRVTLPATLELRSQVDGDPVALVDPVQAHQVVLNLCINARDAMDESGRIELTAREVQLPEMTCASCRHRFAGRFAELAVADSGCGIAPEVLERMFDPFFSTKDIGHGTGMGLSIVHGVVHEHGGHILVDSRRGKGTTFRVLLPLAGASVAGEDEASDDAAGEPASLRGRVLLVEDEQSVLGFMRELLQGWGLEVVAARDPADALNWFSREPDRFDVVLTDHTMPVMTGLELARALLQRRNDIPVLLYSGRSELIDFQSASAAGVRRLLSKPIENAALRAALQEVLSTAA
jgi:PAS domain S-box-containing protein